MLLGYNTNGLQNHRLDDALRVLADHGYRAVALTLDVAHLDPFRCTTAEIDRIAALLVKLDLSVSVETGARFLLDPDVKHEPTLMTADAAGRARRLAFYARAAEIAAAVGARVLSFWSGIDRAQGPDSAQRLVDGVRQSCQSIRAQGLEPAFEPEPGMAVATVGDFERLTAALGADAPALTLDIGHLYVNEERDPLALCREFAPRAAQVHLEDVRRGVHEHLPPGEGDVDFPGVFAALADGGYAGPVCFELSRDSHRAPDCLSRCAATFATARIGR